jgi:hypothetical protein
MSPKKLINDHIFVEVKNTIQTHFEHALKQKTNQTYTNRNDWDQDWNKINNKILDHYVGLKVSLGAHMENGELINKTHVFTKQEIENILKESKAYFDNDLKGKIVGKSCWNAYKAKMIGRPQEKSLDVMHKSCCELLKTIDLMSTNKKITKSLVVGNVQSGKTSHMAGLISIAADQGYNLFIVLAGSIEDLRLQTHNRLKNDLFGVNSGVDALELSLDKNNQFPSLQQSIKKNKIMWMTVLKNVDRLEQVINWLNQTSKETKNKIKALILDDEADFASMNTFNSSSLNKEIKSIEKEIFEEECVKTRIENDLRRSKNTSKIKELNEELDDVNNEISTLNETLISLKHEQTYSKSTINGQIIDILHQNPKRDTPKDPKIGKEQEQEIKEIQSEIETFEKEKLILNLKLEAITKNKPKNKRYITQEEEEIMDEIESLDYDIDINKKIIDELKSEKQRERFDIFNQVDYQRMTYVAYTATPYANLLNDFDDFSLFPRDCIKVIEPSNGYFGANEIFGTDIQNQTNPIGNLNIIRQINAKEFSDIVSKEKNIDIFKSLIDSICWFLCSYAARMVRERDTEKSNTSMLINISHRQLYHTFTLKVVKQILKQDQKLLLARCNELWDEEKQKFTKQDLLSKMDIEGSKIKDYESFSKIKTSISKILTDFIGRSRQKLLNVHVINSKQDDIASIYDKNKEKSLGYILIGGHSLARGLTLENLVSTYFLRKTIQVDTLLQMGRWFGYRIGYELLPRIWMTNKSLLEFKMLAETEEKLRSILRECDFDTFKTEGPLVICRKTLRPTGIPKLRSLTRGMVYTGINTQTTYFDLNKKIIKANKDNTLRFLSTLNLETFSNGSSKCLIAKNVEFSKIKTLLDPSTKGKENLIFSKKNRFFDEIEFFLKWFEKEASIQNFKNWNVVIPKLVDEKNHSLISINNTNISKVERSIKKDVSDMHHLGIGVLRNPQDLLSDINVTPEQIRNERILLNQNQMPSNTLSNHEIFSIRKKFGGDLVPQMLIYFIDKSKVGVQLDDDLVGISIFFPITSNSTEKSHVIYYHDLRDLIEKTSSTDIAP